MLNLDHGNANTNTDFSVSVVEADVTEDLTAISAVDNNGNFIVYTSEGDLGNYPASQINFDEWAEADSRLNAENGAATSVVDDPSNSGKGKVLKLEYNDGNWQNVFIDIAEGSPTIKLDDTDRTITFEIWSDHGANAGQYGYLLKLEGELTTGGSVEKSFSLNGDAQWQTVTVDFSDCTGAPGNCNADNATGEYSRIRIYNWGGGDPSAQPDTSYVDNFIFQEGTVVPAAVDPITSYSENFDDGDSTWASADGASFAEADGYGTASSTNATDWAHVYFNSAAPLDLSAGDKGFSFKIKGPRASKVFLKLQIGDEYWNNHEYNPAEANYTTPGEWQTITVDATGQTSNDKTRIVIFFDTQTAASSDANQDVFQIDDFKFGVLATLGLADVNLNSAIVIYPNPSDGILNISGVEKVDAIRAFSISGQLIKEAVNTNRLDLSSQRSGLYMIEIEHEGATSVNKLIIR